MVDIGLVHIGFAVFGRPRPRSPDSRAWRASAAATDVAAEREKSSVRPWKQFATSSRAAAELHRDNRDSSSSSRSCASPRASCRRAGRRVLLVERDELRLALLRHRKGRDEIPHRLAVAPIGRDVVGRPPSSGRRSPACRGRSSRAGRTRRATGRARDRGRARRPSRSARCRRRAPRSGPWRRRYRAISAIAAIRCRHSRGSAGRRAGTRCAWRGRRNRHGCRGSGCVRRRLPSCR